MGLVFMMQYHILRVESKRQRLKGDSQERGKTWGSLLMRQVWMNW